MITIIIFVAASLAVIGLIGLFATNNPNKGKFINNSIKANTKFKDVPKNLYIVNILDPTKKYLIQFEQFMTFELSQKITWILNRIDTTKKVTLYEYRKVLGIEKYGDNGIAIYFEGNKNSPLLMFIYTDSKNIINGWVDSFRDTIIEKLADSLKMADNEDDKELEIPIPPELEEYQEMVRKEDECIAETEAKREQRCEEIDKILNEDGFNFEQ